MPFARSHGAYELIASLPLLFRQERQIPYDPLEEISADTFNVCNDLFIPRFDAVLEDILRHIEHSFQCGSCFPIHMQALRIYNQYTDYYDAYKQAYYHTWN